MAPVLVVTKNTNPIPNCLFTTFTLTVDWLRQINSMLWFSGKSKQSVVLNSLAFIDATEYIPPQVSGDVP